MNGRIRPSEIEIAGLEGGYESNLIPRGHARAAATALAGLLRLRADWAGRRVAVACTAGNEIATSLHVGVPVPT